MTCTNPVVAYVHPITGIAHMVKCGTWYGGYQKLCLACEQRFLKQYPQGWAYTPGDLCKHGVYVGGCMEDFMCIACENGE